LSDRLPPQAIVRVLNDYFDCQVPTILEHGGEVLEFMGDGLLAIFPMPLTSSILMRCAAACWRRARDDAATSTP
jgi:adenylate cyclase